MCDPFGAPSLAVRPDRIRLRVVAHLLNVDESLAEKIAEGLGMHTVPQAALPAVKPRKDLPASDALSILKNGPNSFGGRKLGVFVSEGTDGATFDALKTAVESKNAVLAVIAPTIGGVTDNNGRKIAANEKIDGGPSVLFDAIALLPGEGGIDELAGQPPVRDFISDALAHCKFIGFNKNGQQLMSSAGFGARQDGGCISLDSTNVEETCIRFIESCTALRYRDRE